MLVEYSFAPRCCFFAMLVMAYTLIPQLDAVLQLTVVERFGGSLVLTLETDNAAESLRLLENECVTICQHLIASALDLLTVIDGRIPYCISSTSPCHSLNLTYSVATETLNWYSNLRDPEHGWELGNPLAGTATMWTGTIDCISVSSSSTLPATRTPFTLKKTTAFSSASPTDKNTTRSAHGTISVGLTPLNVPDLTAPNLKSFTATSQTSVTWLSFSAITATGSLREVKFPLSNRTNEILIATTVPVSALVLISITVITLRYRTYMRSLRGKYDKDENMNSSSLHVFNLGPHAGHYEVNPRDVNPEPTYESPYQHVENAVILVPNPEACSESKSVGYKKAPYATINRDTEESNMAAVSTTGRYHATGMSGMPTIEVFENEIYGTYGYFTPAYSVTLVLESCFVLRFLYISVNNVYYYYFIDTCQS